MKGRTDPSCALYQPPADSQERRREYHNGSGRRPNLKVPTYRTLTDMGVDVTGKTVDLASLPLLHVPDEQHGADNAILDRDRVAAELARGGKCAPSLATIAVSEAAACVMYDIAVNEANLGPEMLSAGDVSVVMANMHHLVGRLMPVFGQTRPPPKAAAAPAADNAADNADENPAENADDDAPEAAAAPKRKKRRVSERNMDPIEPLDEHGNLPKQPHAFALKPVQLSTVGDTDQGAFLANGIIVSNKTFNFPENDARRVSTGRNPAFEETLAWVLITHAYPAGTTYAALGPPSTRTKKSDGEVEILDTPGRNTHEHIFGWRLFMQENLGAGRRASVSSFGFTDIKQTGRDITRRVVPWTIQDVCGRLARMRAEAGHALASYLRELPMKAALNYESDLANREMGGLDLRRMLLVEHLLKGTPLEPLLRLPQDGDDMALEQNLLDQLPPACAVPGGEGGLYRRMKEFCDAHYMDDV